MDLSKIMDLVLKNNINKDAMYEIIDQASKLDLHDEDNIRQIIKSCASLTNKEIEKEKEDKMVELVMKEGITPNLLKLL